MKMSGFRNWIQLYHSRMRGGLRCVWRLGVVLLLSAAAVSCARRDPERPNLIVVLTDDQGYADLGVQGLVEDVKTPHLDALAADGVRFTRAYVTAPQCVPSRAGLLTGRNQQRFGMDRNRSGALPLSEPTIADRLRAAGYRTGMVGKWHLDGGLGGAYGPGGRGFDEYFKGSRGFYQGNFDLAGNDLRDPPQTIRDDRYRIDVQTDAAIAFLERRSSRSEQPFFLYLAYSAPHLPLESREPYISRFREVTDDTRRMSLASLAAIDDGVGRIRQFLREHDLEKRTLLFVFADNGAPIRRDLRNGSLNHPLVGEKGMLTDGGIRVPFLAVWKGVLPGGKVESRAVSALDVAATALALADASAVSELDGVNLLPFLTDGSAAAPHDFLFWRWRSQAAIFDGRWKLVFLAPDRWLLFDHARGTPETDDVAVRHPEVVARLRTRLEAWAAEQQPPGLPREIEPRDRRLYDAHLKLFGGATPPPADG
jgi:arylsulfatase A-like enzyme